MALRLDSAIVRGEIDNTTHDFVTVRLWLVGRDAPVVLKLAGNAWRDVAGRKVLFENPQPRAQKHLELLDGEVRGVVGDITASRKVKMPVDFGPPEQAQGKTVFEWRNSLYLEWFTVNMGRCVVESAGYRITISMPEWEVDEAAEQAQQMANMQAMRDYLAGVIQRPDPEAEDEGAGSLEMSEEQWEQHLRASDRLNDANMEAIDKYGEGEDSESKLAFVMGWDHILEDLADAQEARKNAADESAENPQRAWQDPADESAREAEEDADFQEWQENEQRRERHPLVQLSRDLVVRIIKALREQGLNSDRGHDPDHPLERFVGNTMTISGKLSGALGRWGSPLERDPGYILAVTKRCLNWANQALAALNELTEDPHYAAHRELFDEFRNGLMKLRECITDLRRELRG